MELAYGRLLNISWRISLKILCLKLGMAKESVSGQKYNVIPSSQPRTSAISTTYQSRKGLQWQIVQSGFPCGLNDWELEEVGHLMGLLHKQKKFLMQADKMKCKLASGGRCTVRYSYLKKVQTGERCAANLQLSITPPRVNFCLWDAGPKKMTTLDNVRKKE